MEEDKSRQQIAPLEISSRFQILHKKILVAVIVIGIVMFTLFAVLYTVRRFGSDETANPPNEVTPTASVAPTSSPASGSGIPVFPGAEGFGTKTPGGRGGRVIEVTNLGDKGPGTFRKALETEGARIIVFRIGGVIELTSENLFIRHPYVTIAGQTAPGDGITIIGRGISIITHDVVLQHLRVRPGDKGSANPETNDAIEIFDVDVNDAKNFQELANTKSKVYNIVLDHVSLSWSEDETISIYKGTTDMTISNSIVSEALNRARHPKITHSAGVLVGGATNNVSIHHNIFAHLGFRNPLIKNGGVTDIRNNVIYNYGVEATLVENEIKLYRNNNFPILTKVNLVSNNYIKGPSTEKTTKPIVIGQNDVELYEKPLYVQGNVVFDPAIDDTDVESFFRFVIDPKLVQGNSLQEKVAWAKKIFFNPEPFITAPVTTQSPRSMYEPALATAGATKPKRDYIDARIANEVRIRKGRIIDSVTDVGGYPQFSPVAQPEDFDRDHDGMSDQWELQNGLNQTDSSDGNKDADGDGYTNVEEYLFSL